MCLLHFVPLNMLEASSPAFGEQDNVSSSDFYIFKHFVRSHTKHTVISTLLTFSESQTICWWWWGSQVIEAERWYKVLQKYRKCPWMLDRSQDVTRAGRGGVGEICQSHPCVDLAKIWQRQMTAKKCKNDRANMPWWKTSAPISQPGGGRGVRGGGGGGDTRGNKNDFMLSLVIANKADSYI